MLPKGAAKPILSLTCWVESQQQNVSTSLSSQKKANVAENWHVFALDFYRQL
jgi:hypothetical protein